MRLVSLIPVVFVGAIPACINHVNVQCGQDSDCNLMAGGLCTVAAGTTDRWCAYPDLSCGQDGYRYSTMDVGDGVSGTCVPADVPTVQPSASCIALPSTCGASGNDNCCNSPEIPGGGYYRSYDVAHDALSGDMNFPATLSSFRLDKYEVTVGRFRAFAAAGQGTQKKHPATGAGTHPKIAGSGWEASWNANLAVDTPTLVQAVKCQGGTLYATWTDMPGTNENRPMNCVTWYEAMAFCAWDGGFLPTEAEWNYAAAGGDQQRAYPWSTPATSTLLDGSHASYYDPVPKACVGDGMAGCNLTDLVEVGSKTAGDGRWGQSDLTGNVNEWVLDYYDISGSYEDVCIDCANLVAAMNRVFRGGAFNSGGGPLRTGFRQPSTPGLRDYYIGFRCARVP